MLGKTHLAIGVFAALLLLEKVTHPFVFFPLVIIASLLPDVDTAFSFLGRKSFFRPLQWITNHRGFFHSFTFAFLASGILAFYFPLAAFPFFLGYSLHLFVDSFTVDGIRAFWPLAERTCGRLRVGGSLEHAIFIGFCIADLVLFVFLLF